MMSVQPDLLTGHGFALSLTVGRMPDSTEQWKKILNVYLQRIRRMGAIRYHWVIEWQKRGVPHVHMSAYFYVPEQHLARFTYQLKQAWIDCTVSLGSSPRAQHCQFIQDPQFWFKYVCKHAARGEEHYQRQSGAYPKQWTSSGRLWGKGGDWPTSEEKHSDLTFQRYHFFRRMVWRYQESKTKIELCKGYKYGNKIQIDAAKKGLHQLKKVKASETRSRVAGAGSFVPETVSRPMMDLAVERFPDLSMNLLAVTPLQPDYSAAHRDH